METLSPIGGERVEPGARPRILCVDDEPDVLEALCDLLHGQFNVTGATSGREGLRLLVDAGPFAVVMSDFMMPRMNGAEFLALARLSAPETVRVLLTGDASVQSAIAAVNDGRIFRFLTKPCSPRQLLQALEDAVDQFRMVTSDRALFEHKLENLSEHLTRAERLASLGTMAAVVGHELSNVLTTLSGAMRFIEEDVAQGRLPAREDLASLQHAGDRLAKHSSSLLRLGRPAQDGEPRATDLRSAVDDVVGTLRLAGLLRRVQIQLDAASEPVVAGIGRTELEQVLINLLKNAVEALSEAQSADPLVQITIARDSVRAMCTVSDNANGIPEEKLPLIFEPYYTTKALGRGTGLGLYAVRQIVKGAGGNVSVDSTHGRGTVFTITLPLVAEEGQKIWDASAGDAHVSEAATIDAEAPMDDTFGSALQGRHRRDPPTGPPEIAIDMAATTTDAVVTLDRAKAGAAFVVPAERVEPELKRLRQAVDASGEIIFMTDREGVFTFVNPRFEERYGYSASEVVGRVTPRVLKGGTTPGEQYMDLWQGVLEGQTIQCAFVNCTKDGQLVEIEATVSPIWDETKTIVGFLAIQRDVTARKRADEEVRFQQTMLATQRELTLDGILVVDDHSRVLSYNRRFAHMWGILTECLKTRSDNVLLQAVTNRLSDPDGFLKRVREIYDRNDEESRDEIELTDGRIFDRYSAPMKGADDRYYGRVWYFRDVTERNQAEARLRYERDRAQRFLDVADVILLALDLKCRVTLINRKGCSILEWEEHELLGRNWIETCLPAHTRSALTESIANLQRGDLSAIENSVLTRSGRERMISWNNTVLRDESGRVIGTFSSGTDITERHQAVEALRTAEERMRYALQNADVGIWDMDSTTGVIRWSETSEAHYGLQPGTFGGTFDAFVERIYPADRETVLETVGKALKSGDDFRTEHRSLHTDGTMRWLSAAGRFSLGANGEPERGVGISLDVTHRKKLELELLHAQKLESVGRLASGVAHEINTPVQFVSDSVHFVQDAMTGLADVVTRYRAVNELVLADRPARAAAAAAAQAEEDADLAYLLANVPTALDRSIEGLNRVAAIVLSMKAFAHPDRTEMAAVDLNLAIASTLTIARGEYKYVAEVETDFGDIPLVTCHGGDVNQVFLNIIVNAAHAIGETIEGTTAAGRIVVQTRLDGDAVVVRISDNGGGIPEAIRDRVFEPFFTTKEVGKGTGQGLAIARALIVEKHGGDLMFETELGKGTTFVIRLPIDAGSRAGAAE